MPLLYMLMVGLAANALIGDDIIGTVRMKDFFSFSGNVKRYLEAERRAMAIGAGALWRDPA